MKATYIRLLGTISLSISAALPLHADFEMSLCDGWNPTSFSYGLNPPTNSPTWNCCDWVSCIEYLYWKPFVENAHAAQLLVADNYTVSEESATGLLKNMPIDPHFNWKSGFRIGLGYNFPCDKWGIALVWTHYLTKVDTHLNGSTKVTSKEDNTLIVNGENPAPYFITGNYLRPFLYASHGIFDSTWNLQFNQVDLDLFRDFFVGPSLSMRPYIGLRSLFIRQTINSSGSYTLPNLIAGTLTPFTSVSTEQRLKSGCRGVGLKAGLKTNWEFYCDVSVYGDFSLSAVYSSFKTENISTLIGVPFDTDNILTTLSHEVPYNFQDLKVLADFALGFEWRRRFNCDQNVFHLRFGWEHHLLFKQSNFFSITNDDLFVTSEIPPGTRASPSTGDISLYGFVFAIGVSF